LTDIMLSEKFSNNIGNIIRIQWFEKTITTAAAAAVRNSIVAI